MVRSSIAMLVVLLAVSIGRGTPSLAADEDEIVFQQNCQLCHTAERVQTKHLTRAEWQQIIDKMVGLGCPIRTSKKKQQAVLDYLARTQGPVASAAVASAPATVPVSSAPAYTLRRRMW